MKNRHFVGALFFLVGLILTYTLERSTLFIGLVFCVFGLIIFFNKKGDEIEMIKSLNLNKKNDKEELKRRNKNGKNK
ncbi:hypothetical protein K0A97_03015 [Patescibacteria group bacterium]|nr:hypothetical protein [Patescibacteria group bacterium]